MPPTTSFIVLLERYRSLFSHSSVQMKTRPSDYLHPYCQAIRLIVEANLTVKKFAHLSVSFGIVDFILKISILAKTSVLTQL